MGNTENNYFQNVPKNSLDFPMHEQSISSSKTEAIT